MIDWDSLIKAARRARELAYSEYSGFSVGAAAVTSDGRIFTGCNIENSSFGLAICAERTAVFKAVSEGYREIAGLVILTDNTPPSRPCGACRQVLFEFNPSMEILCVNLDGRRDMFRLGDLYPEPFTID